MPRLPDIPPVLAAMTQTGSDAWIVVSWIALGAAGLCAAAILWDIVVHGHRQPMGVMNWVWPITALYWGPVAAWHYFRRARRPAPRGEDADDRRSLLPFAHRNWWPISKGVGHCGAGCTLGDIVGEWVVYLAGFQIALFAARDTHSLVAMFAVDFALAWTIGIVFQYFSIVPMRDDLSPLQGIWAAIKADTLSIISFQVGLFGFMALYHLVFWQPPLTVASPVYWFMMQIGMVVGFFTAWPVNAWLVFRGWKEKM